MEHQFSGTHIISDIYQISRILNSKELIDFLILCCKENKFTVLQTGIHNFENGGFTVFCLLAESHISFHYYVECNSAFIDIFTCGKKCPNAILHQLLEYCCPSKNCTNIIKRGDSIV